MKSFLKPGSCVLPSDSVERILSRYYLQLVEWSRILARGDDAAAEETVQDLCLHLTVAKPDLSRVQSLDNYLFTCLRNMYVSNLARVSRERLRIIQIEDFDALGMVAVNQGLDTLHIQNELIRISSHVLSRKYVSKSASHFILHFFLGYRRSDVALLARLPISAVYNGLKETRIELREHLSAGEKIRLVPQDEIEQGLLRAALPSDRLFQQLRSTILDADPASCIAEEELVDSYKQSPSNPVACRELAHLAGCERCLRIVERALQLDDRDGPFDGFDASLDRKPEWKNTKSFETTMRIVRQRREQLLERRPGLLAIAVDGRVAAFHAVESAHNALSSRVDTFTTVHFVEVFDEFGDRLAHILLEPESATPRKHLSQQILLSDDRHLRLDIRFDGLGIRAEVDYLDPALAPGEKLEIPRQPHQPRPSFLKNLHWPERLQFAPWTGISVASLLLFAVLAIGGYRYTHPAWDDVLAHAQAFAQVPSPAETLHQTLRVEQITGSQQSSILGSVDIWRSGDKRSVRRLYNAQQQLLATSIDSETGASSLRLENKTSPTPTDRMLVQSDVWRSDVSPSAFVVHQQAEASRSLSGFELTNRENGRNGILVRTLSLDRNYRVQAETVRFRTAKGILEIRLVQTLLRTVPNRDVPPMTFPQSRETTPGFSNELKIPPESSKRIIADPGIADVEVAVLFQLFQRNVDIGQPIEVSPTAGGRVRMAGTLSDAHLVAAIRESVAMLPDAGRVDFQIYSARQASSAVRHGKVLRQQLAGTTSDAPATELVRDALLARGLKGAELQSAEQEFMASALAHAQTALQHAYALDRLGTILRGSGSSSLSSDARIKWAQMVDRHSTAAVAELRILRLQLNSLSPSISEMPSVDEHGIADAPAFTRTSSDLLAKTQSINSEVVNLFAGSAIDLSVAQTLQSISHLCADLPLDEANRMHLFASRLTDRQQNEVGEIHHR